MANNEKKSTQNTTAQENWRKPLQVPPRSNAMRNFYQGSDENLPSTIGEQEELLSTSAEVEIALSQPDQDGKTIITENETEKVEVETKPQMDRSALESNREHVLNSNDRQLKKLTAEDLSIFLGFEIEDLFDINELLRGKSLEIYQTLVKSSDEKGRCKITQPELMKLTGIKNRRTFYKHEQWLLNLHLLEKRHLPGDHKGVVYRVFEISEMLPVPSELVEQFEKILKDSE